jgi:hypothetical protein
MQLRRCLVPIAVLCFTGCYHASVETGRPPGSQHIDKAWASSYLGGTVAPSTVEARSACPQGVSKVETKHSFLNGLVAVLTLSIYTPMSIEVTCAASAPVAQTSQEPATSGPSARKARASR